MSWEIHFGKASEYKIGRVQNIGQTNFKTYQKYIIK